MTQHVASLCLLLVMLSTYHAWQPMMRIQKISIIKMSTSYEPSILDEQLGHGFAGTGDDWSHAPSSTRSDRPLNNQELRILTAKSNQAGLVQLFLQLGQIGTSALLLSLADGRGFPGLMLRMIATAVMGFGLVTMGHCAQHECIHNTAFKSRRLNVLVSWLVSLPRLTNPRWERMLHKGIYVFILHALSCTASFIVHHLYSTTYHPSPPTTPQTIIPTPTIPIAILS